MSRTFRRNAILILGVVALLSIGARLREAVGLELSVASVRGFVDELGVLGPLIFVLLVAMRSLLALPSQVVLIAAGLCFGTLLGTLIGGVGMMLNGTLLFLLARYAGRASIEKRLGERGSQIFAASGSRGAAAAVALGSGYPISPFSPIQIGAGLSSMPLLLFLPAALVGGWLRAGFYAVFGDALVDASGREVLLASVPLVLAVLLPLAFPSSRRFLKSLFRPEPAALPVSPAAAADSAPSPP